MCGIAGIVDLRGARDVPHARVKAMADALAHRGPDGEGFDVTAGAALAHRRLAVIDPEGGVQPFHSPDGRYALLFNGAIYNFQDIARELEAKGHKLRTRSDTEALLHAYMEWGAACVDRLVGMFAFAIWDRNEKRLFCARDRFGEKPFYYTTTPDGLFLFASELCAIEAGAARDLEFDAHAFEDYKAFGYIPDPKTIYKSVRKLPPAHTLTFARGDEAPTIERYWRLAFRADPDMAKASFDDLAAELKTRFAEVVKGQLIADVPLGAFLSGGVDSSGVVACMAQGASAPVETCSIGFDDPRYDESGYAQTVATRYATNHHMRKVTVDAADLIDRIARAYSEPFADSSALPTYLVSQAARENVTVALSGDGGDEIFAGYRRYAFHQREEQAKAVMPAALRGPVFGAAAALYPKLDWAPRFLRAKATFEALSQDAAGGYFRALSIGPQAERSALAARDVDLGGYRPVDLLREIAAHAPADDPLSRAQAIDLETWLPGGMLTKVDRASMAHGLETRAPFLDHRLAEWAAGLPADARIRRMNGKAVLKKAFEPLLPHEVLYRPKQGFSVPLAEWLRGDLRERVEALSQGGPLRDSGLVNGDGLKTLTAAHLSGARNHARILWAMLMFDAFLRREPKRFRAAA